MKPFVVFSPLQKIGDLFMLKKACIPSHLQPWIKEKNEHNCAFDVIRVYLKWVFDMSNDIVLFSVKVNIFIKRFFIIRITF